VKILRTNKELSDYLLQIRLNYPNKKIGFVPTMGALHEGHISLIEEAKKVSNLVICSVFVNPTQFNDQTDLANYPRTELADIELLSHNLCDAVYLPEAIDIYPDNQINYSINLNGLDAVMEGKFRNNHFMGVCMVVERFFNLVEPDYAFFGTKDFQQVAVIKYMAKVRKLKVKIIACPIKREESGLAMSSRNKLLSKKQMDDARVISESLFLGVKCHKDGYSQSEIIEKMLLLFNAGNLKLEYLEIINNDTLKSVNKISDNCSICIAAYCGPVRLIDNCQFL
jgi:pantoate--beta-alanine ligase